MNALSVCLFYLISTQLTFAVPYNSYYNKPTTCRYDRVNNITRARCANLKLETIPQTLRKNIQILDFTRNRFGGKLMDDTLLSFTSLSHLYFTDNFFTEIGDAAFLYSKKLEVLDISKNSLENIPKNIFALPVLKKLYLNDNSIEDSAMDPTPFAEESVLEFLDVSKNRLTKLPRMGISPHLKHLNISRNRISNLNTEDIANFCFLEILDITQNPITFNDSCECQTIIAWTTARNITMLPPQFNCDNVKVIITPCHYGQPLNKIVSNKTMIIFENCKNILNEQIQTAKTRSKLILVVSCTAVFIFSISILFFYIRRYKQKKSVNICRECDVTKPVVWLFNCLSC